MQQATVDGESDERDVANVVTTATSYRFEIPKITANWLIVYPFGVLVGLAYFAWTVVHFEAIYF
jgi:hypothetical protein